MSEDPAPSACPLCGSEAAVPIVYGLPDEELMRRAEAGEVTLGGCLVTGEDPSRCCKACGHEW